MTRVDYMRDETNPRITSVAATKTHSDVGSQGDGQVQVDGTGRNNEDPATMDGFLGGVEYKAYHLARHAIWDHEQALDIVQDSMLKLVEKYSRRPAEEWPALFYTILNNRIRDIQRRRMVQEKAGKIVSLFRPGRAEDRQEESDLLETTNPVDPAAGMGDPAAQLSNKQLRDLIERAVSGLPRRQNQVFVLREWQGLNVRETAQVLGCAEGSVKQHHFRAMRAMRKQLAEVWQDD